MNDIFTIAAGVLMGGILLAMFLAAVQRSTKIPADEPDKAPWWVIAGVLVPMGFLLLQFYFHR